ncbi:hypothetical protein Efla_007651 [Eimeria flavescens]
MTATLNSLSDKDLVRFVIYHLRGDGDALLWWLELSESNCSQHLDDWTAFKAALRRRFVQWNAASTENRQC